MKLPTKALARKHFPCPACTLAAFVCALLSVAMVQGADSIQTLDLKPVLGHWPLSNLGAEWMLPAGRQVLDGVPFQMDGILLLSASNSVQRSLPGREKIEHITVGRPFQRLHLLAGADSDAKDGVRAGIVRLHYSDGSDATLDIRYGEQLRNWQAPWHGTNDVPLTDTNSRVALVAQHSSAAQSDKYFRLFHVALTNPAPDKHVTELSLESPKTTCGLLAAAISVGPADAERLTDTTSPPTAPFPDLRPRNGELATGGGIVKTLDGEPLDGARIRVMAARDPKTKDGTSNPEDAAVGTESVSKADGRFSLPALPDNKLYRLICAAEGFELAWYRGFDPKSDPIEIRLKPLPGSDSPTNYAVHGRLVGPDARPVSWATIEPDGVEDPSGTGWGGPRGFPEQVVSLANGDFTLSRTQPFKRVQTRIHAGALADTMLWLEPSNSLQTIELGVGVVIRGRVVKEGKPLSGLRVGICGVERWSQVFAGHYDTKTADDGRFAFQHTPTNVAWYLYGVMDSFKAHGALPPTKVQSGNHGQTNDLGDLEVVPGLRLAGHIQIPDGQKPPKGLKIRASSEKAWDSQSAPVDSNGRFAFDGLYGGQLTIGLDIGDWRLTGANRSLDLYNPFRLTGVLEDNKDDIVLAIEKGPRQFNYNSGAANGNLPQQDRPENRPLAGVERSGPPPIVLAGQVVDDKTGEPIKRFKVIPGYKPPVSSAMVPPKPLLKQVLEPFAKKSVPWNELPFWEYGHAEELTNRNFNVEFAHLTSTPILRVESAGYEPADVGPIATNAINLIIRLRRGAGPSGIVLLPNGKPASAATVLYLAEREQCGLTGRQLSNYGSREGLQTTGADGRFSFPLRAHGMKLFVSHPVGWAEESVERGGAGLKIQLQPWASVAGTLVQSNSIPAAGVDLGLTIADDWMRGDPHVNIQGRTTTDAQGNFAFADVPPRRIEVQRIIPMGTGGNGWRWQLQTWLQPQAGISNYAGKIIYDQPPPPPVLDQIKQKLGL